MQADWTNITDPVFHWAAERPDQVAFYEGHQCLTYGELAPLVAKAAVHLGERGIRAGDRVALSLTNSIDHFILLLGLLRLGATPMEIPYEVPPPSPELLAKFSIRSLVLEPAVPPPTGVSVIRLDASWRDVIARAEGDNRYGGSGEEVFVISLTSGTTGTPKGSLNPQRRFFPRLVASAEPYAGSGVFSPERPANYLLTSSLGFSVFFRRTVGHLFFGGAVVILPELRNAIDLVKVIASWDNALCYLPAAMCRFLIAAAPAQGYLFPKVRALIGGGGFLYPQEKLAVLDRVTPRFYHSYGASGFGQLAVLTPEEMRERPASVGRPPSTIEVEAVGPEGVPLPPGTVGQLRARGTEGHGLDADPRFRAGWYYPGDFGHIDAQGFIFLRGRDSEAIARGEAQVFATEIETAIALHPAVAEVSVVGVPRAFAGDDLVAMIVERGAGQHEAIAAHCRARLPSGHWPDRVFYVASLPRTAAGKIDREQVRNIVMNELDRQVRAVP